MPATMETREYELPDGQVISVQFFTSMDRFRHVVTDHLLRSDKKSPEPWERPLSRKFLQKLRKDFASGGVSSGEAVTEAYDRLVEVLDEGIDFSAEFPLFVKFTQERQHVVSGQGYQARGFYFLSWDGIVIIVREAVVRTALFRSGTFKQQLSREELVHQAWTYLKSPRGMTRDTKGGEDYRHVEVEHVPPENWIRFDKVYKRWPRKNRKKK